MDMGILCGILLIPHNIVMNLNNVMIKFVFCNLKKKLNIIKFIEILLSKLVAHMVRSHTQVTVISP